MNERRYLIDTVTLSKLDSEQLQSDFVQKNCKIPGEIIHEFQNNPNINLVRHLEVEIDLATLDFLVNVMEKVTPQSKIIDLYNSEGNGDVILIATALKLKDDYSGQLFPIEWVIVTDDVALRDEAKNNTIGAISTEDFKRLIAM